MEGVEAVAMKSPAAEPGADAEGASLFAAAAQEQDDDDDGGSGTEIEEEDADGLGPELEALLSTLTPLQILLMDEAGEEDAKIPLSEADGVKNNASDYGAENGDDAGGPPAHARIDPLLLITDLTTEHRARILLASLLSPSGVTLEEFYDRHWGKSPLLACLDRDDGEDDGDKGNDRTSASEDNGDESMALALKHAVRLEGFLDRTVIDEMIRRNKLRYGLDLNVTRYTDSMGNGVRHRITLDPPPRRRHRKGGGSDGEGDLEYVVANPDDVWCNVDSSHCTLRLLRPHEHNDAVHSLLSLLESEFGCMVGSNAYLYPLNSQGFAPHYDDVDVFVLQLEGYKRWRVHPPFTKGETLPRESSRDFTEKEVGENSEEEMNVVLGPGDVLYLPRGWIHQAETVKRPPYAPKLPGIKDDHSLHLTVSTMQKWCWADLLELLLPEALEAAAASDRSSSLREGLPRNFLSYMGIMHQLDEKNGGGEALPEGLRQAAESQAKQGEGASDEDEAAEEEARARRRTLALQRRFKNEAKKRIMRVCRQTASMLDEVCDRIGTRFLSDRLPPALLPPEQSLTKGGGRGDVPARRGHHHDASQRIWPNTLCRIVRPGIARLVVEDGKAVLYHCLDNSRVYRGAPLSPMEFEVDDAPALEQLLTTTEPRWIMVRDLIHGDIEDKMGIAQALYDEGLLAVALVEAPDRSVQTG